MYNRVILIGRLTKEIEVKETSSGSKVGSFTLAVNRDYDKEKADFIQCQVWNKTAEIVSKFTKKGSLICVEGSLQIDKVDTNFYTKINVGKVTFLGSEQGGSKPTELSTNKQEAQMEDFNDDFYETSKRLASEDDIPF